MSGAIEVTEDASSHIEELIADMLGGGHKDNQVLLGVLQSGEDVIQVQLKVTRDPADFMDEC
ncbi:hypothetical protein [Salinivibrio socompensis]|uniref:hypothetical protein n=1 Tax=Salinivibrio socompensis TaxID=1510206 RepID=UPI00046F5DE1|nr:hypothetical protein [Salinivibrio socompensis]